MINEPACRIDLEAYLRRIGYSGTLDRGLETFKALHFAHATHIPFENIDVLRGEPIRLDCASLEAKLLRGGRGGYCFEHNTLFADVLEQLGFRLKRLQARVRVGSTRVLPRTHMALEVEADGQAWLADVGFGGWGLLEPVPLVEGASPQFSWDYRLRREGDEWVLAAIQSGQWQDMYIFSRDPYLSVDYEPPNYYVSNHPDSIFRKILMAQLPTPQARYILRNRELIVANADGMNSRALASDEDVVAVLAGHFGLRVAPGPWLRFEQATPTT